MVPSSLHGHAGMGIYTTRDLAAKESILAAPDGPSIPVVTREPRKYRNIIETTRQFREMQYAFFRVFGEYWWGYGVPDHVAYEARPPAAVMDYQITFSSLPNHHCVLSAIDLRYPLAALYQDNLLDRYTSPGAGAVSYAAGRDFFVSRAVQAGEELFLNYGYCQRNNDENTEEESWKANITTPEDVQQAAVLIRKAWNKYKRSKPSTAVPMEYAVTEDTNPFVKALLPKTTHELHQLVQQAHSNTDITWNQHVARHQGTTPRTPEWIRQHGMCLEHLIPGRSHMPHAGRGGVAQYHIDKGDIVVPAPLLHILDRDVLFTQTEVYDDDDEDATNRNPTELLINYCLGHADMPLLLCPNTNAILINHCSTRLPDFRRHCPEGPNAAYQWATGWDPQSAAWQQMTLEELSQQSVPGLAMQVVALRPIQPGREVFVDYGVEWENAWLRHVRSWKPPPETPTAWITAAQANQRQSILPEFITGDLRGPFSSIYRLPILDDRLGRRQGVFPSKFFMDFEV